MGPEPSRYIPKAVQQKLREDARERCSLTGHLIPSHELNTGVESSVLEQHHVVFFADGGGNSEDNLMLVCPNCHARVHRYAEEYPVAKLREAKRLWIGLKDIVPDRLYYAPDLGPDTDPAPCKCLYKDCLHVVRDNHLRDAGWTAHRCCSICAIGSRDRFDRLHRVWFSITSLNLTYSVDVPESMKIGELTSLIRECILRPVANIANSMPYVKLFRRANLSRVGLAEIATPEERLSPLARVSDLNLSIERPLVPIVKFEWVALSVKGLRPILRGASWIEQLRNAAEQSFTSLKSLLSTFIACSPWPLFLVGTDISFSERPPTDNQLNTTRRGFLCAILLLIAFICCFDLYKRMSKAGHKDLFAFHMAFDGPRPSWKATGIKIQRGESLEIYARMSNDRYPDASLVAKVGSNGPPSNFSSRIILTATQSGELFLDINIQETTVHHVEFVVKKFKPITLFPATPPR